MLSDIRDTSSKPVRKWRARHRVTGLKHDMIDLSCSCELNW